MAPHFHRGNDRGNDRPRPPRGRGQSLVEFALTLPVFLLLSVGVLDLANVFSSYIALTDGVREAALFAADGTNNTKWCAIPPDDTIACPSGATGHQFANPGNIAYQIEFDAQSLDPSEIVMSAPMCAPDPCDDTSTVTVVARYTMPVLTPVLSTVLGGTITMFASTTAKVIP